MLRSARRVFLKAETLQRTGSFKFRGAYNKLSSIPPDRRAGGVVAYSSGNHAQGVAAAAQLLGMPAVIVMPSDAPRPKRERTAALGAEIVLYDRDREDRAAIARDIADKRGAVLVPPFDDPMVIAGQGTAGREIVEDLAALGLEARRGGGRRLRRRPDRRHRARGQGAGAGREILLGRAGRLRRYRALVQERQARGQCAHERHDLRCADDQYAGRHHLRDQPQAGGRGDVTASDAEVGRAVAFAFRELKLVVEPGGAIGLAALLAGKLDVKGKVVVAVLSGGNVDAELFHRLVA